MNPPPSPGEARKRNGQPADMAPPCGRQAEKAGKAPKQHWSKIALKFVIRTEMLSLGTPQVRVIPYPVMKFGPPNQQLFSSGLSSVISEATRAPMDLFDLFGSHHGLARGAQTRRRADPLRRSC